MDNEVTGQLSTNSNDARKIYNAKVCIKNAGQALITIYIVFGETLRTSTDYTLYSAGYIFTTIQNVCTNREDLSGCHMSMPQRHPPK